MVINFIAFSGILIATSSFFMANVMFVMGKKTMQRLWGVFCLAVFVWGGCFYFIALAPDADTARLWWKISHVGVIFIPVLFIHFVYSFLDRKGRKNAFILSIFYAITLLLLYSDLFTDWLIHDMRFVFNQFYYDSPPAPLYPYFVLYFNSLIIYGHILLGRAYFASKDELIRGRILYFFVATVVGFLGGSISFSPVFGMDIYPGSIITVTFYPVIMGYAVLRYQLFNMRVVTAQILTLIISIITGVRLFLSYSTQEYVVNSFLLIFTLTIGIFLVRSVNKEVEDRERIELLAKNLETANEQLKILDQQKSEFVSIASHQLRSPLTAIKGYTSMLLEGSFGDIPEKAREAIDRVSQSSLHLVALVEDLLNISRIEQGRMVYDFVQVDLCKMIKDIMGALMPNVRKNNLELTFHTDNNESCMIYADYEKIRQVILNIIDNAIKYTPKGFVRIKIYKDEERKRVVLSVKDSGIGVTEELKSRLFEKFSRGDGGARLHVNSTGLGLYVAKEIMKAHKGDIWVESPGEGKGSTFYVEFLSAEATEENSHNDEVADFAGKL